MGEGAQERSFWLQMRGVSNYNRRNSYSDIAQGRAKVS